MIIFRPVVMWALLGHNVRLERKLAEYVMFVYGAADDINTNPVGCGADPERGAKQLKDIGTPFTDDLEADIRNGGHRINLDSVGFVLEKVELPVDPMTPEEMRNCATILKDELKEKAQFSDGSSFRADRLIEMALLVGKEHLQQKVIPDLQIIRTGELAIYGFPGEPFLELGQRIMAESVYPFVICSTVTNGNCRYFPTKATFDLFKDGIYSKNRGYGYYEIYQGCGRFMPAYKSNIADFIVNKFLSMRAE